jgi:lysozyme
MLTETKKRILKIGLITICAGCLALGSLYFVYFLFYEGYVRLNYPSYSEYPVQGIDVSNHQHEIDWEILDKQQVQFAFIKATEGGDFKDKSFEKNWENSNYYGVIRGAYHFFTFCKGGEEQAANFIETVPNEPNMLPPVVDLEYGGNCKLRKNKEELLSDIDVFIQLLEEEYHKPVIIYVMEDFYEDYLIGRYLNNPIWFRDVRRKPKIKDDRSWLFWQFANRGHLDGIDTFVDLNVFNGTKDEFDRFVHGE